MQRGSREYLCATWTMALLLKNQEFAIFVPCFHTPLDQLQYHISGCENGMVPEQKGSLGRKGLGQDITQQKPLPELVHSHTSKPL